MVVKDKQGDIAILRTIGAKPSSILRIFVAQGSIVGIVGTLAGVALGVLVALNLESIAGFFEAALGIKLLAADVYFISDLPSELSYADVVRIAAIALVLAYHLPSRVLLLDADVRRPVQHTVFQHDISPGFANVLAGDNTVADAARSTRIKNLDVMPAGTCKGHVSRLFGGRKVRDLVDTCLRTLVEGTREASLEIIVVDGMSDDGTFSPMRTWVSTLPPRWDMPWISFFLTSIPAIIITSERTSLASRIP